MPWACRRYGQKGGLRSKQEGQQVLYAKMSSLAYKSESERIAGLAKLGFNLDKTLSNDDIMIAVNPKTSEIISAMTGSRFDSKKHRFRDTRTDIGTVFGLDRYGKRKKELKSIVLDAKKKYKDFDHTLTGHSLSGRQAQNISKETGIPAVTYNRASSPASAVADKISKWLGKDNKDSKVISYTTGNDFISKSAQLLGDEDEMNVVKMKKEKKKGIAENHSIDNFTGEGKSKKVSPWIAHVRNTRKKHGCSYKEALGLASKTYKK